MPDSQQEYRIKQNELKISHLEDIVSDIIISHAKIETKLDMISKKLENGISHQIESLNINMNQILPFIESKRKLEDIIVKSLIGFGIGGAVALLIFLVSLYFKHGPG